MNSGITNGSVYSASGTNSKLDLSYTLNYIGI